LRLHVPGELVEKVLAPRDRDDTYALQRKQSGDRAANSDAGAADEGGLGLELEIHVVRLPSWCAYCAPFAADAGKRGQAMHLSGRLRRHTSSPARR